MILNCDKRTNKIKEKFFSYHRNVCGLYRVQKQLLSSKKQRIFVTNKPKIKLTLPGMAI